MLGALFGGKTAAESVIEELSGEDNAPETEPAAYEGTDEYSDPASPELIEKISHILLESMGIVRSESGISAALDRLRALGNDAPAGGYNAREQNRLRLAEAMLLSALERRESRGAHYREDYPEKREEYRRTTVAELKGGRTEISFRELPERRQI